MEKQGKEKLEKLVEKSSGKQALNIVGQGKEKLKAHPSSKLGGVRVGKGKEKLNADSSSKLGVREPGTSGNALSSINGVNATNYLRLTTNEAHDCAKKVLWADKRGRALTEIFYFKKDDASHLALGTHTPSQPQTKAKQRTTDIPRPGDNLRTTGHYSSYHSTTPLPPPATLPPPHLTKTYREALLTPVPPRLTRPRTTQGHSPNPHPTSGRFSFKGRCFRCLGRDHRAYTCRDLLRCTR